jgi:uracil-DNA glycosylase family 4
MDEDRRRAWDALGLGPLWRLRDAPPPDPSPGRDATAPVEAPVLEGSPFEGSSVEASLIGASAAEAAPRSAVPPPREQVIARMPWPALGEAVAGCVACGLSADRRHTVFGTGPQPAPWLLVGEAPGEQEDAAGEPFVGAAGQLLDQMLAAIGVDRARDAFIANVLKCRPPRNRDPLPQEAAACEPFLLRQVALLQPRIIVVLGRFAAQSLLRTDATISSLRGRLHAHVCEGRRIPMVVTYHPAYLLRNLPDKAKAWADLRLARRTIDAADA